MSDDNTTGSPRQRRMIGHGDDCPNKARFIDELLARRGGQAARWSVVRQPEALALKARRKGDRQIKVDEQGSPGSAPPRSPRMPEIAPLGAPR